MVFKLISLFRKFYWGKKYYFKRQHIPSFISTYLFGLNKPRKFYFHFTSVVVSIKKLYSNSDFSFLHSPGLYIQAKSYVFIGKNVFIGPGVKIISSNHSKLVDKRHENTISAPIVIGNNVWLGANVVILPGVQLGDNCIVGAGSVVTKSFPADSIIVGTAAKNLNAHL